MKKIIICLLLVLSMFQMPIHASSAGYYYESIDVQVEVNSAREYKITETLNVYYEEQMHGIIRSLPESSDVEGYIIGDIHVEGAPYVVEDNYGSKDVRIGDANTYVKGRMQYTLSYTLYHYQDYDQFHDYIYLNLIGDDFDTRTEKLTATITWPENFEVEAVTLTDGIYGNRDSKKMKYTNIDNGIKIENTVMFEEYEAATVQVSFPQNTFVDAPEYHFPYTITSKKVNVVVDESQDWHVQQKIELDAHDPYVYYYINPEFDAFWGNNASLVDFKGTLDGSELYDEEYVDIDGIGTHVIEMSYTIHTPALIDDSMYFLFLNEYEASTDYVEISITMPNIDYSINFGRYGDVQEVERYADTINNETLSIVSTMPIQAAEQLEVILEVNKADFYRPTPLWAYILPTLGSLLAGLSFLVRLKNKQIMVTPVQFYPPNGINSAEAGYLIDESLSNVDMTSLIFYWAHMGCLKIHDINKKDFMLEKIKDLPDSCPSYERTLFHSMFAYGDNHYVIESQLEEKFYRDISIASSSILTKYKKTFPIREKKVNILKTVIQVLAMFIMLVSMIVGLSYELGFAGFGFAYIAFIMPFVFIYALISFLLSKVEIVNLLLTGITYFVLFVFISLMEVNRLPLMIVWGVTLLAIIMVSFMKRYTEYGLKTIGDLKGFKEFLVHAEKDQLEMLLEENPEYYYAILPYAQALNVTKIWQDKFKDIAMVPATYYVGESSDYRTFTNMTNNVQKSMRRSMSAPASSYDSGSGSSGGGYSGGGGGFSGGGSSGGGSGGGSSRGW